jgi:hypothetical protein
MQRSDYLQNRGGGAPCGEPTVQRLLHEGLPPSPVNPTDLDPLWKCPVPCWCNRLAVPRCSSFPPGRERARQFILVVKTRQSWRLGFIITPCLSIFLYSPPPDLSHHRPLQHTIFAAYTPWSFKCMPICSTAFDDFCIHYPISIPFFVICFVFL